jgi:ABC-type multidrug transport system ATPase subunit
MDEPTTSLDPIMHELVIEEINHCKKSNTTFLISSHSLDDIKTLADEIVILKDGKIIDIVDAKSDNVKHNVHNYILSSLKENS